jgi:uncharacterized membrane protein YdjX (TVP38/TMEM64 family)
MEASGNFTSVAGSAAALADEASAHTFPAAVLVAMAVVTTDTVPLLPTQPVAVFAGAALGFTKALAAVVAGQAVATVLALCIGRYWLARRSGSGGDGGGFMGGKDGKARRFIDEMASGGLNNPDFGRVFFTIAVARQSPVLPFSLGNYLIGALTDAPALPVVLGTVVGCFPLNCFYIGVGAGGMQAVNRALTSSEGAKLQAVAKIVGILTSCLVLVGTAKAAYKVFATKGPTLASERGRSSVEVGDEKDLECSCSGGDCLMLIPGETIDDAERVPIFAADRQRKDTYSTMDGSSDDEKHTY